MAAPDPVDLRLLSFIAETGRAAVHEIAPRLGMDVREVASRLAALSTTGLPIVVGVECDPNGIRNALASVGAWGNQPSGPHPVGPQPVSQPVPPQPPGHSGPHASPGYPAYGTQSGPYPAQSGPYPAPPGYVPPSPGGPPPAAPAQAAPSHPGPQAAPSPGQAPAAPPQGPPQFSPHGPAPTFGPVPYSGNSGPGAPGPNPAGTWGPPGSASWVRGDQPAPGTESPAARNGRIGSTLEAEGLEGERISILLVEVVDPADFLYTAAGYTLQDGERSVVVHTELTNRGSMAFTSLPDLYLVLVASDGSTMAKATVQLSSRPPHRMGVPPGETAGGHTVFVLPEDTELTSVRWTSRPGDEQRTLTWDISDL